MYIVHRLFLFDERHAVCFNSITVLQPIKICPACETGGTVPSGLKCGNVPASALMFVGQECHHPTGRIEHLKCCVAVLWERIRDRGFRIERIREILAEKKIFGTGARIVSYALRALGIRAHNEDPDRIAADGVRLQE